MNDEGLVDEGVIGRGASSLVSSAFDRALERSVAKKVLRPERAGDEAAVEAFLREARVAARLEHPGIVPVHALGRGVDGRPWFTMRRVEGRPLSDLLPASLDARDAEDVHFALEVFLKVCDAVAYAHARGVLHRDLKPQNVVVGRFGEAYVVDWGTAMRRGEPLEPPGTVVGTLEYMPPEQARGAIREIDERSDVFGLGALLYHLLVLQPPYRGKTREEVRLQAAHGLVRPPQAVAGDVPLPRELCRIAMRALEPAPCDRPPDVATLRHDVAAFARSAWRFPQKAFAKGALVVEEGAHGDEAFILEKGRAEVVKRIGGTEVVLRPLVPGDVFGETAALTGLPRTASVRAVDDVVVAIVRRADFEDRLGLHSWLGRFVTTLADRFRDVDQRAAQEKARADEGRILVEALRRVAKGTASLPLLVDDVAAALAVEAAVVERTLRASDALSVDEDRVAVR